jgi:hypothetical protein
MSEAAQSDSPPVDDLPDANPPRSSIFGIMIVTLGVAATLAWTAFLVWLAIRIL